MTPSALLYDKQFSLVLSVTYHWPLPSMSPIWNLWKPLTSRFTLHDLSERCCFEQKNSICHVLLWKPQQLFSNISFLQNGWNWFESLSESFQLTELNQLIFLIFTMWNFDNVKLFTSQIQFQGKKNFRQMQIYFECWLKWTRVFFAVLCWFMSESSACINWF